MADPYYIPFDRFLSTGGPTTFMKNLKFFLDQHKFRYQSTFDQELPTFFPVMIPLENLSKTRKNKKSIIQRLDGIYYPSKHGKEYKNLNKDIKLIYKKYASYVIFQSEYSKKQCFKILGKISQKKYFIIHNGVNKNIFYPLNFPNNSKPEIFKLITTGNFRNIDMLEPVIMALDQIKHFKFELTIVGPVKEHLNKYLQRPYVNYAGSKNMHEIADLLRQSHLFVYSHLNPPCPNSVLEAIATGLPVIAFKSGAMEELCFFNTEILADVSKKVIQKYRDFNFEKLKEKVIYAFENFNELSIKSYEHHHHYDFNQCGQAYMDILTKHIS